MTIDNDIKSSINIQIQTMIFAKKLLLFICIELLSGLDDLVIGALDSEGRGFESRSSLETFQTISTPTPYLGLSLKWTGRRRLTDRQYKVYMYN